MLFNRKKLTSKIENLERELTEFRSIQDDLKKEMMYCSINTSGKIKEVNEHFLNSSSYSAHELVNHNFI